MTYSGTMIAGLAQLVDSVLRDRLRVYKLQNSLGEPFGCSCEMLESESLERNLWMSEAGSDYRWTVIE